MEELDGEILLCHAETDVVVQCNATAGLVLGLCDGRRTVGEIVAALEDAYPEDREHIGPDVIAAVDGLLGAGVLRC